MTTLVFINKNGQNAPVSMDDRIFLGEGLFETLRVAHGKPCYAKLHWQRLQNAASFLDIPFDVSLELWLTKLLQCIQTAELQHGGVKIILSGGRAARGLLAKTEASHLIFSAFSYVKNTRALNLISAPWTRDHNNPIYKLKSTNYLEAIIAQRHAKNAGADDVLFFNDLNHATETSLANFFIIKNNQLYTPPIESGLLAGIIRQRLLMLSKDNAIGYSESPLDNADLVQADAMFVCNSLQGLRAVSTFDQVPFAISHPLFTLLQDLLAKDSF